MLHSRHAAATQVSQAALVLSGSGYRIGLHRVKGIGGV